MMEKNEQTVQIDLKDIIRQLVKAQDLTRQQMQTVMSILMQGEATDAQIGAFLTALAMKGETVDEIIGAVDVMRQLSAKVDVSTEVVDCVGTGGDGAKLFNVSTASSLVASAAGVCMAKHGNRAATGNCGSADLLEKAGVNIALEPHQVADCIEKTGIGFLFAPTHHAAIRHVIAPRKEIGIRTVFNLLGPLTNPANPKRMLVGVFSKDWLNPVATVLAALGAKHVMVVCSQDGLDEISIAAQTSVVEYVDGKYKQYVISPEQFGLKSVALDSLLVNDAEASLSLIRQSLQGKNGAAFDMIALNAGATLYVAGASESLEAGVHRAKEILVSGAGWKKLQELVDFSQQFNH